MTDSPPPTSSPAGNPWPRPADVPAEEPAAGDLPPTGRRRRRLPWLVAAGAALVVAVAAIVIVVVVRRGSADRNGITEVATTFAAAIENSDQAGVLSVLCAEEAEEITEDDDYDPGVAAGAGGAKPQVFVSELKVAGDTASAQVSQDGQPAAMLYFRKESGAWKVCAPAGPQPATT